MNRSEYEIYNEIIKREEDNKRWNEYLLSLYKWNIDKLKASVLYNTEYTYLDYLDWRKNLIEIPNYCKYNWKKVSKQKIKNNLLLKLK